MARSYSTYSTPAPTPRSTANDEAMFLGKTAKKAPGIISRMTSGEGRAIAQLPRVNQQQLWREEGTGVTRRGMPMWEIADDKAIYSPPSGGAPDRGEFQDLNSYLIAAEKYRKANGPAKPRVLGDVMEHPELFANHPDLQQIPFRLRKDWDPTQTGAYTTMPGLNGFQPQEMLELSGSRTPEQQRSSILHEIQHAVQQRNLGWQTGGNLDIGVALRSKANGEVEQLENLTLIRELLDEGHSPQDIMMLGRAGKILDGSMKAITEAQKMDKRSLDQALLNSYEMQGVYPDQFRTYQRMDGEVQARNTQYRQLLDDAQRRQIFWKESEDLQGEPRLLQSTYGRGIARD